jgi:hypothetical protein
VPNSAMFDSHDMERPFSHARKLGNLQALAHAGITFECVRIHLNVFGSRASGDAPPIKTPVGRPRNYEASLTGHFNALDGRLEALSARSDRQRILKCKRLRA